MLTSVTGVYRDGKIILTEQPKNLPDDTQVIVTFLRSNVVDLSAHGIDEAQAAELRSRLQSFAADWDSPEMDIYDDYDTSNATR
jgi:hypothetical protein